MVAAVLVGEGLKGGAHVADAIAPVEAVSDLDTDSGFHSKCNEIDSLCSVDTATPARLLLVLGLNIH